MHYEAPLAFLALLLIPLVVLLYYWRRGRGSVKFSTTDHARRVRKSLRVRLMALPLWLRVLTLACLAVALARPQEGKERVRDVSKGIAIQMVVDRSGSMAEEMEYGDERQNRLEAVKRVFGEFVAGNDDELSGRPNDLIGMICFARYPDTVCPLTLAHGAVSEFIENVKLVRRRSEDGTAIGDALALAAARLQTAEEDLKRQLKDQEKQFELKSKIIILLTDGQNNAGKRTPQQAAELAKEWGIKIYTIGVGAEGLARRDDFFGSFLFRAGQGVDEATLKSIADTTGGAFRMAENAASLRAIYEEIDELERSEIESVRFLDYKERFQPLAFVALGLLLIEVALGCTAFRRLP